MHVVKAEKLEFVGHHLEKVRGKQFGLLGIKFTDMQGKELTWWPKWAEVRMLYVLATFVEWSNEGPYNWGETKKFVEHARGVEEAVRAWAKEWVEQDRRRLKRLLDNGNFRQAAVILNTDLLKVANWLDQTPGRADGS